VSWITLRLNRYPQEALQNGGIGFDTTPVVTGDFFRSYRQNRVPWGGLSL
jgi:hypothetical protein